MGFGDLNDHLVSDFDKIGMARLVGEWAFGFCKFCGISRHRPPGRV